MEEFPILQYFMVLLLHTAAILGTQKMVLIIVPVITVECGFQLLLFVKVSNESAECSYIMTILSKYTAVDCGDLTNPENGRVEFVLTTYESLAKYYCNSGYNLVGTNTRTCQANGTWKNTAPSCTRKNLY